jgi:hypothetical protein
VRGCEAPPAGLVVCRACGHAMAVHYQRGADGTLHPASGATGTKKDYAADQCR